MKTPWQFTLLLIIFLTYISPSLSTDTVTVDSPLRYGGTLESSPNGNFTLGFFKPGTSDNFYLGIWYTNINRTILWVANRDNPMRDASGVLYVSANSTTLWLETGKDGVVWSVRLSNSVSPVAKILETGNFVLVDKNTNSTVWQSFDYPTDTLLPGMNFGWVYGEIHYLTSWMSWDNPKSSNYTVKLVQFALPEIIIWNGSNPVFRTGPWNGELFTGITGMEDDHDFMFEYVSNQNDTYVQMNSTGMLRLMLNKTSFQLQLLVDSEWQFHWSVPDINDMCDKYDACGPNAMCLDNPTSHCECLSKSENTSDIGCQRRVGSSYTSKDKFMSITNVKLPDTVNVTVDRTIGSDCEKTCLTNSSCTAYTTYGDSSCVMWTGNLADMRQLDSGGSTLYYRIAGSEVQERSKTGKKVLVVVVCLASGFLIVACAAYLIRKKSAIRNENLAPSETHGRISQEATMSMKEILEEDENILNLPVFDASIILAATENFALSNKLGEGGFGTVFKGVLEGGQKVAIKRLTYTSSTQGLREFKNEVVLIAELQHINLVRLLGCCVEGEERMLVYEYMENRSLDTFLFDEVKSSQLDWQKRFEIIMGIARGILYLHQDSRLRIIHRDLKASNVLLDDNMNPKISDFGIARIFGRYENHLVTNRVVGTYGYMSPEYAMYGVFSVKSDVFSFGVLILEIISGKKICEVFNMRPNLNLLSYAWTLLNDGNALKLLDTSIPKSSRNNSQIIRCIQVGLSCVQDNPEDRPNMSEAILMLNSPNMTVTQPKRPGYFSNKSFGTMDSTSTGTLLGVDITVVEPR